MHQAVHLGRGVLINAPYFGVSQAYAAVANRYGFGLMVDTIAGNKLIQHGGNIHGFATANAWVAGEELSVTVLANKLTGNPGQLMRQVMRAALGLPPAPPPSAAGRRPPP